MTRFMSVVPLGMILCFSLVLAEDMSLTVYNTDLAVVKVENAMSFERGLQTVSVTDVAERIDPTSVRLKAGNGVTVHEQNFRYDLVSSHSVLEKYIDREINLYGENGLALSGTLLSVGGDAVVRQDDGSIMIVRLDTITSYALPELPGGLITRPTLVWLISSDRAVSVDTELSYMTGGIGWHAEYTAVVNEDEDGMELSSWVSVQNQSGATYNNASLKLVAGDVNRATPQVQPRAVKYDVALTAESAMGGFEERGLFEYHLYELEGQTTLRQNEIKQIALFDPTDAAVKKLLIFDPQLSGENVTAMIEFTNSESDGLGIPLPAGTVRVYKRDTDDSIEFVGEDRIDHTPKNEDVRLNLGSSFDIAGERRVMNVSRISDRVRDETIEIELRNRKDEPVEITAVEHLWGDWTITRTTDNFVKKDANTAECTVSIPADTEKIITFTVRYQ